MTERNAILLAGAAHVALLLGLSLSWAMAQKDMPSFQEASPVEVVDVSELPTVTELPKPSMEAAPQEMVEEAAPEPTPEESVAEPEPTPAPEPKTISEVPPPDVKPKPIEKPKPPAETKPKTEAKTQAVKKADRKLDAQELANLLDKDLPKAKRKPLDTSSLANSIEDALPKGVKLDARATASLAGAIRAQVAPCWNPPLGGADVRNMTVLLRIRFAKDGRVVGTPEVVSQTAVTAGNATYARVFAETAKRAVIRCSPLKLPADLYEAWREIEFNFDPSEMT